MQINNDTRFKIENIRKHTVIQFGGEDLQERYRAELAPHFECAPITERKRGRRDKILCG